MWNQQPMMTTSNQLMMNKQQRSLQWVLLWLIAYVCLSWKKAFPIAGARIWNSLPVDVTSVPSSQYLDIIWRQYCFVAAISTIWIFQLISVDLIWLTTLTVSYSNPCNTCNNFKKLLWWCWWWWWFQRTAWHIGHVLSTIEWHFAVSFPKTSFRLQLCENIKSVTYALFKETSSTFSK